jgi:DnaJ-class molecular chaperone
MSGPSWPPPIDPRWKYGDCPACDGTGWRPIAGGSFACNHCGGTGNATDIQRARAKRSGR